MSTHRLCGTPVKRRRWAVHDGGQCRDWFRWVQFKEAQKEFDVKDRIARALFGDHLFSEDDDHQAFRYRLLVVVLLVGSFATWVFVWTDMLGVNRLEPHHRQFMSGFALLALLLWLVLRGRPQRFTCVAWSYQLAALGEYAAAWFWAPHDELRVLWVLVNVPGVYIFLGNQAGAMVTALCLGVIWWGNSHNPAPYSSNALVTLSVGLAYLAAFFHVLADRSWSYFIRMREANRRLSFLAHHDPLTGLLNARAFADQAQRLMAVGVRQASPSSMLFVDVDHFKRVNDTHGHAAGDAVLSAVARALASLLRQSDVLGRVGGEEFAVFLPNTALVNAVKVAEQLRSGLAALEIDAGGGVVLKVTASFGAAATPVDDQASLNTLRAQADQAMYAAKAAGRNRVVAFPDVAQAPAE
jgi:diguanylate cyclase (GGDEF)-like protein